MDDESGQHYVITINETVFNWTFTTTSNIREPCQLINSERNRILAIVFTIIFCLSVVGNCLVIFTIVQIRWMRSVTNLFLLNLAVSDLLLTVMCMPPTLTAILFQCFIWGKRMIWMCTLISYLQPVSVAASVNTLMAIALERYFALCRPLYNRQWKTKSKVIRMIFGIWLLAFLFSIPHAIVAEVVEINPGQLNCRENWPSKESHLIYFIFLLLVLFVIPLIVMTFLYSLVIRSFLVGIQLQMHQVNGVGKTDRVDSETEGFAKQKDQTVPDLRRKRRVCRFPLLRKQQDETSFPLTTSGYGSSAHIASMKGQGTESVHMLRSTHAAQSLTNKKRLIKMLAAIVAEFFICWMPFYTYYLVVTINTANFNATMHTVFLIMAYLSTCTNPITYCFMNGKFRKAFLAAFGCICARLKRKYVIYNPHEVSGTSLGRSDVPLKRGQRDNDRHGQSAKRRTEQI